MTDQVGDVEIDDRRDAGGARASAVGSRASDVRLVGITHDYGDDDVLRGIDLNVEHGELVTLLGPSGSGKSTLLRIVGGLERPRGGRIEIGDEDVTAYTPERREVGIVFQNYALFPHMTVRENIAFPLRMRRVPRRDARPRVDEMLEIVELTDLGERHPAELSGGQQQRVALARALVFNPRVLLLDEPFGALDRRLREQLGLEVRRVQRELGITTIFVTHDQDEAFTMSNRIAVMGHGEILQLDQPAAVYSTPSTLEVARFVGQLNEFPVSPASGGGGQLDAPGNLRLRYAGSNGLPTHGQLRCAVRPEHIQVAQGETDVCVAPAIVQAAIFGGNWTRAQLELEDGSLLLAVLSSSGPSLTDGDRVWVGVDERHGMLFDETTGAHIGS